MPVNEENFSIGQLNLIESQVGYNHKWNPTNDYIRLTVYDANNRFMDSYISTEDSNNDGFNDIPIYEKNGNIYVKPNELLEQHLYAKGTYFLKFDFVRNIFANINNIQTIVGQADVHIDTPTNNPYFYIKEISPSRKEIRLYGRYNDNEDLVFDDTFRHTFSAAMKGISVDTYLGCTGTQDGNSAQCVNLSEVDCGTTGGDCNPEYEVISSGVYEYDYVLSLPNGESVSIINYTFDDSNPEKISLILRFNTPIPNNISLLTPVSIDREVINTQIEKIFYISNIKSVYVGGALEPDTDSYQGSSHYTGPDRFQNYEELITTSSIPSENIDQIINKVNDKDINLNIDYSEYKNHVLFGSAVSKLDNFIYKAKQIEEHLTTISSSFYNSSGSGEDGWESPKHIRDLRKSLFSKISTIKKSFTPYEKFMYYDGQMTSTASAPGLGPNFAYETPVANTAPSMFDNNAVINNQGVALPNFDGFSVVYKHSNSGSMKDSDGNQITDYNDDESIAGTTQTAVAHLGYVDLFSNKYRVENPPFYNYTGSVYLSFIMKGNEEMRAVSMPDTASGDNFTPLDVRYKATDAEVSKHFHWINTNPGGGQTALDDRGVGTLHDGHISNIYHKGMGNYPSTPLGRIPRHTLHRKYIEYPSVTASMYRRYVFEASQSHWRPTGSTTTGGGTDGTGAVDSFGIGKISYMYDANGFDYNSTEIINKNKYYEVLSTSEQVFSSSNSESKYSGYPIELMEQNVPLGSTLTASFHTFTGSLLPGGELFSMGYVAPFSKLAVPTTSSFMSDVRITLNDPSKAFPFGQVYRTGSQEWIDWYDSQLTLAQDFDEKNIHSLENNLPSNISEEYTSDVLKTFINMWGEQFDLTRNYVDTYKTFYKRQYDDHSFAPSNLLPILGDNLGWELINPFSSSLSGYFSNFSGSDITGQKLKHSTWKKTLNNLIYIYKSKGTLNSVNALLNIYGYPTDIISLNEYGGSLQHHNPSIIDDAVQSFGGGLSNTVGNVSYIKKPSKLVHMRMGQGGAGEPLRLDWWTNQATGSGIEFMFKAPKSLETRQTLLKSVSGSLDHIRGRWDLSLISVRPGDPMASKLQLRIASSSLGGADLSTNAVSASTAEGNFRGTGWWNVLLQRKSGSTATHKYELFVAQAKDGAIPNFYSLDLGSAEKHVKTNWSSSKDNPVSGNLLVGSPGAGLAYSTAHGTTFTGSIAEIRMWDTVLSASKFKQHVLNPFSTVANGQNDAWEKLIYRYKLAENTNYNSIGTGSNYLVEIKDSSTKYPHLDYTRTAHITQSENLYSTDLITTYALSSRVDSINQKNDNKIILDPKRVGERQLNPTKHSTRTEYDQIDSKIKTTTNLDLTTSTTDKVDEYVVNQLSDKSLHDNIGNPSDKFERNTKYKDLESLRKIIMDGVEVKINDYIRAQEKSISSNLLNSLKQIIPARTQLLTGVVVKPDILDRTRLKNTSASLIDNAIYADGNYIFQLDLSGSEKINPYLGTMLHSNYFSSSMEKFTPYNLNKLVLSNYQSHSMEYFTPYNFNKINLSNYQSHSMEYFTPYKLNELVLSDYQSHSMEYHTPYEVSELVLSDYQSHSMEYHTPYELNKINISSYISQSVDLIEPNRDTYISSGFKWLKFPVINYLDYQSHSMEYHTPYQFNEIGISSYQSQSMEYFTPYNSNQLVLSNYLSQSIEYHIPHELNKINVNDYISQSIELIQQDDASYKEETFAWLKFPVINYTGSLSQSIEYFTPYNLSKIALGSFQSQSIEYFTPYNLSKIALTGTMSESIEYHTPYNLSKIALTGTMSESIEYHTPYDLSEINIVSYISQSVELIQQEDASYKEETFAWIKMPAYILSNYQSHSIEYFTPYNLSKLTLSNYQSASMEYIEPKLFNELKINNYQSQSMELIYPYSGTVDWVAEKNLKRHTPLNKGWGRTMDDVWLHNSYYTAPDDTFNTMYYVENPTTYVIGDTEYVSMSTHEVTCPPAGAPGERALSKQVPNSDKEFKIKSTAGQDLGVMYKNICLSEPTLDYTDPKFYKGRKLLYENDSRYKDNYISYHGRSGSGADLKRDGIFLGTTVFFTSSDGGNTLIYPPNHVRNYHMVKDQLRHTKYTMKNANDVLSVPAFNNEYDTKPELLVYSKSVDGSDTEQVLEVKRFGKKRK